jgi:hypothetical protein
MDWRLFKITKGFIDPKVGRLHECYTSTLLGTYNELGRALKTYVRTFETEDGNCGVVT